ncbi:winged helix-turn-helix transcriptional regulator [Pelagibius litoralis]|uniref:Winged helix-turn-helix transcriptional regulator n=1 Tax=Pelagibius litoralis TaxID=374515 RepID=A0A967F118_9PROT|nr:metalloregulator ArsR/SmtB family transcription factor [Pelagibius litoralis]NIA71105.1 winged helix-turn-helix transcriptional regulator [Pelagibius litoralis]
MTTNQLDRTLSALADPTRRAILAQLTSGERTVTELAEPFEMTMPAVTKHIKVLEKAGLVERSRDAQKRPCRLRAAPLKEVSDWIEEYRQSWEESLDRLGGYLQELQSTGRGHGRKEHIGSRKNKRRK